MSQRRVTFSREGLTKKTACDSCSRGLKITRTGVDESKIEPSGDALHFQM